ncbi:MAG: hypothetical protein LWY06_12375, partial [Firmicutes bacterium]|nr:hypothetical protein [Bacillota bacterium]
PNEQERGKNEISVILCNHQGKILKTYQFKRKNSSQFFPGISPDEKNIVFRNFSGEINIRKIPEKYLAEAVDTVLRK